MEISFQSMEIIKAMAETGNPNSVSDAGVGALCALTAVKGAHLNVKINAGGVDDKNQVTEILNRAATIEQHAIAMESEILGIVNKTIGASLK
jgi:glutamate formiminotransferase/formiminotetrahydrofolate cyclodeaminase